MHLLRAGGLLGLLVAGMLIARSQFVPESFGQFGFYRGDNVAEWAVKPLVFQEAGDCQSCHPENYGSWSRSDHTTVTCENCHSPADEHVDDPSVALVVDTSRELCGVCHGELLSRPDGFPQVDLESHGVEYLCVDCHNPHNPFEGLPPSIPHTLEEPPNCLPCHAPGSFKPFPANHEGRSDELCVSCHRMQE